MFTKYDEFDLLELFLSEPKSLTDNLDDGEVLYSIENDNGFKLSLYLYTYRLQCDIFLNYNDETIFNTSLNNVTEIKKYNNELKFFIDNQEKILIQFKSPFYIKAL
ncbi:hypothetical protein [Metabacillus arenae]|uniref:Uncharacterized protein n=1 Tax=Metabacillus arenae TaxID=2771434 RepID=A0A926RYB2_9BACI|nr:hypothetical protein [Metabacillus arenae]MBD1381545.1 hypothetical protein [Metabacillus arenae]